MIVNELFGESKYLLSQVHMCIIMDENKKYVGILFHLPHEGLNLFMCIIIQTDNVLIQYLMVRKGFLYAKIKQDT